MLPPWPQIAAVNQPRMNMSDCGCHPEAENPKQRRVLWIALALNAAMALIGGIAGWMAQSTGLLADALDMLWTPAPTPLASLRSDAARGSRPTPPMAVAACCCCWDWACWWRLDVGRSSAVSRRAVG